MYVNPRPLTFSDLSRAMQESAGLGQIDLSALNALPLTGQTGETPFDTTIANASLTSAGFQAPWGMLALVAGLILFSLMVGKK